MKRLLAYTFLLAFIIMNVFPARAEDGFYSLWGLQAGITCEEAAKTVGMKLGIEFKEGLSPDETEFIGFYCSHPNLTLSDAKIDFIQIRSDIVPASEKSTTPWNTMDVTFEVGSNVADEFKSLFQLLCQTYGEPTNAYFTKSIVTLDGKTREDMDFPKTAEEINDIILSGSNFTLRSVWNNIDLYLGIVLNKLRFSMGCDNIP